MHAAKHPQLPAVRTPADNCSFVRLAFTNPSSGETFGLTLGLGLVVTAAVSLVPNTPLEDWTMGQRRRIFKRVIREGSHFVEVEEEEVNEGLEKPVTVNQAHEKETFGNHYAYNDAGVGECTSVLGARGQGVGGFKTGLRKRHCAVR